MWQVKAEEAIAKVEEAFRTIPRPEEFIRGTCRCYECLEHDATLAAHTPDTIHLAELGSPAWDPICFANDAAFAYYLPAMVRLAFEGEGYLSQLLFHLNQPERLDALDGRQIQALFTALQALSETRAEEIAHGCDAHAMEAVLRRCRRRMSGSNETAS